MTLCNLIGHRWSPYSLVPAAFTDGTRGIMQTRFCKRCRKTVFESLSA